MKVLHIGKYYPPVAGGIENFMGDLLPALSERNVTNIAIVHQQRAETLTSDSENNIIRVPSYGRILYAPICPAFPYILLKTINDFKPDIIHIHVPNTSAFWLLVLKKAKRIPWVIHWHSDVISSKIDTRLSLAYKIYRPFEQALLRQATQVICTTPNYLETSFPLHQWREKCTVIPLGINPERLKMSDATAIQGITKKYWSQKTKFKLIVVGRLTYYKGHETLLKAARHLSDVQIIIVGTGDTYHHLSQRIQEENLQETVQLVGHLPDKTLQTLIQSSDCLCLPSIERTEAFGLVLLEAMRYAKPVIATSVQGSGMNWVVDNNITGLLIPPENPSELITAIQHLQRSPNTLLQMGKAGKIKFDKYFHINKVEAKIKKVYVDIHYSVKNNS